MAVACGGTVGGRVGEASDVAGTGGEVGEGSEGEVAEITTGVLTAVS